MINGTVKKLRLVRILCSLENEMKDFQTTEMCPIFDQTVSGCDMVEHMLNTSNLVAPFTVSGSFVALNDKLS